MCLFGGTQASLISLAVGSCRTSIWTTPIQPSLKPIATRPLLMTGLTVLKWEVRLTITRTTPTMSTLSIAAESMIETSQLFSLKSKLSNSKSE